MRVLLIALFVSSFEAHALDLEYFKFTNNPTYSITDNALLDEGHISNDYPWLLTASYNYVKTPLSVAEDDQRTEDIVENMQSLHIGGGWKPRKNILLGLRTRVSRLKGENTGTYFGDSVLEAIWKFREANQTAWALQPKVVLPTGSNEFTTQSGKVGGYLGLNVEHKFNFFQAVFNIGYFHQPGAEFSGRPDLSSLDYKDAVYTALGTLFPVTEKLGVNVEAYRFTQLKGDQHPNEVYAGLRHQTTQDITTFGGLAGGGLIDESSNDYRISVGIKYVPWEDKTSPVEAPAPVKREEILKKESSLYGTRIHTENTYFAHNSSELTPQTQKVLKNYRSQFKNANEVKLILEGYASPVGDSDYNMVLSRKRAEAVRDFLVSQGMNESNIKIVAYGDSRAEPEVSEALNRKVMIRIYKK